jgi:hypothetical protein
MAKTKEIEIDEHAQKRMDYCKEHNLPESYCNTCAALAVCDMKKDKVAKRHKENS